MGLIGIGIEKKWVYGEKKGYDPFFIHTLKSYIMKKLLLLLVLLGGCTNVNPETDTVLDLKSTNHHLDLDGTIKPEITRIDFEGHTYIVVHGVRRLAMTHDPDCKCNKKPEKEDYGY